MKYESEIKIELPIPSAPIRIQKYVLGFINSKKKKVFFFLKNAKYLDINIEVGNEECAANFRVAGCFVSVVLLLHTHRNKKLEKTVDKFLEVK